MPKHTHKLSALTQNVVLGAVTGIMVGIVLRLIFLKYGGVNVIWMPFFLFGPIAGYLSGLERQRIEKLKKEKSRLVENIDNIQSALERSNKKYRLLVEQANDAIFLTSVDGRFILFNTATCRYSGYSKNQLKKMNLKDLQKDNDKQIDEAWLDNGVYRYDECWISRMNKEISLEINARWIQFGDHRLILHVGRDIKRQNNLKKYDFIKQVQQIHESKLTLIARLHENLYEENLKPIFENLEVLKAIQTNSSAEIKGLQGFIQNCERARNSLVEFSVKNERDLGVTPMRWDLNEILHQELVYLDTLSDSRNFKVKTAFSADLKRVTGYGRDFSLAFEAVFQALRAGMVQVQQKGLYISTRLMDSTIMIEIMAPGKDEFYENVLYYLDPIYQEDSKKSEHAKLGKQLIDSFFKVFKADFDAGYQKGKGTIIRIRVPVSKNEPVEEKGKVQVRELQTDVII